MKNEWFDKIAELNKERNSHYNCFSFAVDNYDEWLELVPPFEYERLESKPMKLLDPEALEIFVNNLQTIHGLKLIDSPSDFDGEVVAFRTCRCDFHFMVRKNGDWFHKQGILKIEYIEEEEVVSLRPWLGKYDSKIYYFAKEAKNEKQSATE